MHLAFEALPPGVNSQPLPGGCAASACCSMGMVANVIATTPNIASADTIATIANLVSLFL